MIEKRLGIKTEAEGTSVQQILLSPAIGCAALLWRQFSEFYSFFSSYSSTVFQFMHLR